MTDYNAPNYPWVFGSDFTTKFVAGSGFSTLKVTTDVQIESGSPLVIDLGTLSTGGVWTLIDGDSGLDVGEVFADSYLNLGSWTTNLIYDTQNSDVILEVTAPAIPEPVSALAVILGVGALGRYARRRRRA